MGMGLDIDGIKVLWWHCCAVSKQAITAMEFSSIFMSKSVWKIVLHTYAQS